MQAPADLGPIYTVPFLPHATSARQAYDMSYDCRSVLKRVLKCMRQTSYRVSRPFESFYNVLYTLPLFVRRHRLLERGIHIFPCLFVGAVSEVYTLSLFGTAFSNQEYTLPLFVCRHRLLERGIHTFPCLFVGAGSEVYTLSLFGTGF